MKLINAAQFHPPPVVEGDTLVFPAPTGPKLVPALPVQIPLFSAAEDPEGVASHVPHMEHFYDNSLQTGLMRDLVIDFEVLEEHLVLLGNQVSMLASTMSAPSDAVCRALGRTKLLIGKSVATCVNVMANITFPSLCQV